MAQEFQSFVILGGMRTGSNLLEANLNALEGVTSYGEVFNPNFVGKKNAEDLFGISLAEREKDPRPLLRKLREETAGLSGFRLFRDHDPRVLELVLADPTCAKIILTRNPVDSYVSLQIARETGQWKLGNPKRLKSATAHFDEGEFALHLAATQGFQLQILRALQTSGQTAFVLDYEDLESVEVLNGLAQYLGLPARLKAVDDSLKKQNPEPIEDKVDNPAELMAISSRVDLFGLARSPVFEPRRLIRAQEMVACEAANLLFFPVSGAPNEQVRDWLARFGTCIDGMDHRSLRQWKQSHPGHRSFAVIRHPLLRAYEAFHSRIVSGQLQNHRRTLIRSYGAVLPEPGERFADPAAERRAFLVFLHYARLSVLGQCGNQVDQSWASQTAILQGISAIHPLDHILREGQLGQTLPQLARDSAPGPVAASEELVAGLRSILDERLEKAAAAAYVRDYSGFGFGPWSDQAAC